MRVTNTQLAKRINGAWDLLKQNRPKSAVMAVLMSRYRVSRRQAYRYVQKARKVRRKVAVPEEKIVFTVKVPVRLVHLLRRLAKAREESLSSMVTEALKAFIGRNHG